MAKKLFNPMTSLESLIDCKYLQSESADSQSRSVSPSGSTILGTWTFSLSPPQKRSILNYVLFLWALEREDQPW